MVDAAKPEQRPSHLPSAPDGSPGLLIPQPVLPQEAVLPLLLKNVLDLSLPLTSSPQRIPQISKSTRSVLGRGPEHRGNFPSFSCFPEPGGRGCGNTPAEGKCSGSGPLRGQRLETRCLAVVCFSL